MTACKSSGLSKPTAGCSCSYCRTSRHEANGMHNLAEGLREDPVARRAMALGYLAGDVDEVTIRSYFAHPTVNRAWNEALATKRMGEDTFEDLAHQAQNSPRNHKHASDTEA